MPAVGVVVVVVVVVVVPFATADLDGQRGRSAERIGFSIKIPRCLFQAIAKDQGSADKTRQ